MAPRLLNGKEETLSGVAKVLVAWAPLRSRRVRGPAKRLPEQAFDGRAVELGVCAQLGEHGLHVTLAKSEVAQCGGDLGVCVDELGRCRVAVGGAVCVTEDQGSVRLAFVLTLVAVYKEHWASIEHKTPMSFDALNDAGTLAVELLAAVGIKDQAPLTVGEALQAKQKAFKLLLQAYDDARRAVTYLRWHHDDADEIAPSLYAGRRGQHRSDEAEAAAAPPLNGAAPATAPSGTPPNIVIDNSAGLPIDSPLTN